MHSFKRCRECRVSQKSPGVVLVLPLHWTVHTTHWTMNTEHCTVLQSNALQTRLSLSMFALVLTSRSVDFDVDNDVDKEKLLSWWCLSGPMFSAWLTPPIVPHLSVYVFNITNPEEVGYLSLSALGKPHPKNVHFHLGIACSYSIDNKNDWKTTSFVNFE